MVTMCHLFSASPLPVLAKSLEQKAQEYWNSRRPMSPATVGCDLDPFTGQLDSPILKKILSLQVLLEISPQGQTWR